MTSKTWGTILAFATVLGLSGGLAWWFNDQAKTQAEPKATSSHVVRRVKPKKKSIVKKVAAKPQQTPATREIDAVLRANRFVGTALVIHHNQVVYQKGWGYADAAAHKKNGVHSVYQLASVQKSFTAGLIMKLASEGKLNLTDPLSKYYPTIAGANSITLRDMLDMKSGLTLSAFPDNLHSEQGMIRFILTNVVSRPSQIGKWDYSPVNFMLLSGIIEKVSHQSYRHYFTTNITRAWNLKHTGFVFNMADQATYSRGYQNANNADVTANYGSRFGESKQSMYYQFGTGQVYMSARDLYTAQRNMLQGKLYPANDVNVLLAPGTASMYGGGMYVYPGYIRTHGLAYGYEATTLLSKDGTDGVVLLSNYYRVNQLSQTPAIQIWNLLQSGELGK